MNPRNIDKIIVHCTAGNIRSRAVDIVDYHLRPKVKGGRGWNAPGYHYIIEADGSVIRTWAENLISNGVQGHNANSINVCYVGGVDQKDFKTPADTRTPEQRAALLNLLKELKARYPSATIYGHRDFAAKACPSFDAKNEYQDL